MNPFERSGSRNLSEEEIAAAEREALARDSSEIHEARSGARDLGSTELGKSMRPAGHEDGPRMSNARLEGSLRAGDRVMANAAERAPIVPVDPRTSREWNKLAPGEQVEAMAKFKAQQTAFAEWQRKEEEGADGIAA